jgi:ribosomal protein S18 acetylase RimI-like enzyme
VNVYYLADVSAVVDGSPALAGGVTIRSIADTDIPPLAATYLRAFGPVVGENLEDAAAQLKATFAGARGVLWAEASLAAWEDDEVTGAVLAVRRPSWKDAPDYPWLIDVFTDPRHRRAGVARALLVESCRVISAAGEPRVGLTVDDANLPAVALYRSLGFSQATR